MLTQVLTLKANSKTFLNLPMRIFYFYAKNNKQVSKNIFSQLGIFFMIGNAGLNVTGLANTLTLMFFAFFN